MIQPPPDPHPLDFDWRYSDASIIKISELIPRDKKVLAIGCPSLVRYLDRNGRAATLIDRQPLQCTSNQIQLDMNSDTRKIEGFTVAVLDPPWYPAELASWTAWAAHCVGIGGSIFLTIWPFDTRPTARKEYDEIVSWMSEWSRAELLDCRLTYETPKFEQISNELAPENILSSSPRIGHLLRLDVCALPKLINKSQFPELWHRFVFDNYQLGVRTVPEIDGPLQITKIDASLGWSWPFVSRRAPRRESIGVWSSCNEVATITGASKLVTALNRLVEKNNVVAYIHLLDLAPQLSSWMIPQPPYWRKVEWCHRQ